MSPPHTRLSAEYSAEYMPHLDGLRAIAVMAVLVQHWFVTAIPVGSWGVILFFVISGYLIR
jgi:peptidoglycan/LPS O-acetylase OafA/YrhL